ncbi:MAG: FAD-binding oxidoreductase [Gammaproteobacteria bacterium]
MDHAESLPGDARALRQGLEQLLGSDAVLADPDDRAFYGTDIRGAGAVPALVIRPGGPRRLARALREITDAGFAVLPRGGGVSYTGGFVPNDERSVIVDTQGLDRIVDVDVDNMFVTVEAGVTWAALRDALEGTGLRTPFMGPLSGAQATVGGSLAQHAILWGSAGDDASAASVLSLQVALADGTLLDTGSAATDAPPFFRWFGPDLAGLFLGDAGALGVKTRATLKLSPEAAETRPVSFNFTRRDALSRALCAVARSGLASTCFGMDPVLQYQRIKRASLGKGVRALGGVLQHADSTFSGLRTALRTAVAGRRFIDENGYSLHAIVEGETARVAHERLGLLRDLLRNEGEEIPNALPTLLWSNPWVDMSSAVGPDGERWAPMHGVFALTEADRAWERIEALFESYAERFDALGIVVGYLLATVSRTAFVVEPVFYWPGPPTPWHERMVPKATLRRMPRHAADPEVERTMNEVRGALVTLFADLGAAHLQIGRTYSYLGRLDPGARRLLEALKTALDPRGLMNPGALGLATAHRDGLSP